MSINSYLTRKNKNRVWWKFITKALEYAVVVVSAFLILLPFIWMFLSSFKVNAEIFVYPPKWVPSVWRWENYKRVLDAMPFGTFTFNSLKISTLSVIGQLLSCSLAAFAFARLKFPGRDIMFTIWLACLMIPTQVLIIPLYAIYNTLGLIDTHLPLILPNFFGGAFGTFLLRQFFMTIPTDFDDAATIDGATKLQIYWHIYLPMAKPALATLAVFVFMANWNDLLGPIIYLTSYNKMTLSVGLAFFKGQYTTDWPLLMSGALISIIPITVVYAFAQRYFVNGVVLSGLKG
jgi:multiple sugar transport system permease protein